MKIDTCVNVCFEANSNLFSAFVMFIASSKQQLLEQGIMGHLLPYIKSDNSIVTSKLIGVMRLLIDGHGESLIAVVFFDCFVTRWCFTGIKAFCYYSMIIIIPLSDFYPVADVINLICDDVVYFNVCCRRRVGNVRKKCRSDRTTCRVW